jgi:hypothetical protein
MTRAAFQAGIFAGRSRYRIDAESLLAVALFAVRGTNFEGVNRRSDDKMVLYLS